LLPATGVAGTEVPVDVVPVTVAPADVLVVAGPDRVTADEAVRAVGAAIVGLAGWLSAAALPAATGNGGRLATNGRGATLAGSEAPRVIELRMFAEMRPTPGLAVQ
jgi:hypothetical protein